MLSSLLMKLSKVSCHSVFSKTKQLKNENKSKLKKKLRKKQQKSKETTKENTKNTEKKENRQGRYTNHKF